MTETNTIEQNEQISININATEQTAAPVKKVRKGKGKGKINKTAKAKGRPGRPSVPVKLIMTKTFTLKDLAAANPGVKPITLRNHVIRAIEKGTIVRLADPLRIKNRRGKPASRFVNTNRVRTSAGSNRKSQVNQTVEVAVEPSVV